MCIRDSYQRARQTMTKYTDLEVISTLPLATSMLAKCEVLPAVAAARRSTGTERDVVAGAVIEFCAVFS